MNAISKTAWYPLGVRVADAASARPIVGDDFARRFYNAEAEEVWDRFRTLQNPNASNASRHRIIDDLLREELARDPTAPVIVLGAGFDTRAFRLDGGRWLEIDEPHIIAYKDAQLPAASAKNPLERISMEFGTESLRTRLEPYRDARRTHVVVEGVFMYLSADQRRQMRHTLRELYPDHVLYCDLMTRSFFDKYSAKIYSEIQGLGASFTELTDSPENEFVEDGYVPVSSSSHISYASRHGALSVPRPVVWFMRMGREGYKSWKFLSSRP